jgi:hypothetical protein
MRQAWPLQSKNGFGDTSSRVLPRALSSFDAGLPFTIQNPAIFLDPMLFGPTLRRVWLYFWWIRYKHTMEKYSKKESNIQK